jgi:hypothetical protein
MKKCPNCQREFPDTMRFCQTDGTPLPEVVEEVLPEDLLKTQVVRSDEIAAMIPPDDPFKTMVAAHIDDKDEDDVLQIPQEFDPLATMVVSPLRKDDASIEDLVPEPPAFSAIKDEIKPEPPPMSVDAPAARISEPPPPVFDDPVVEPPSFSPAPVADDDVPATVFQSPFDIPSAPPEPANPSPYSSFETPASEPPKEAPQPQAPPIEAPQSPFGTFGSPAPEPAPQSVEAAAWNPPPAPVQGWGQQSIGQETPFQPPVAGASGQSQGLAIASLVCGGLGLLFMFGGVIPIISLICLPLSLLLAIAGIITGFLARGKAKKDPQNYGGAGLALGGIISGGLALLLFVGLIILGIALGMFGAMMR